MSRDEEFAEFVGARWARFVRAAVLLGCAEAEAEDLAQSALLRCYQAWPRVAGAADRDAYTYRILLNCHRDSRRRHWWQERPTATLPELGADDETGHVDTADGIDRALARLSTPQREAVVLRYYAHLGELEMAAVLGVAPGTVKSRLSRALAELARDPNLAEHTDGSK